LAIPNPQFFAKKTLLQQRFFGHFLCYQAMLSNDFYLLQLLFQHGTAAWQLAACRSGTDCSVKGFLINA
jgi:hypothetical protein